MGKTTGSLVDVAICKLWLNGNRLLENALTVIFKKISIIGFNNIYCI